MKPLVIFPAYIDTDGAKRPLLKGWQELASSDPEQIRRWIELYKNIPTFFFGVPTGKHPNGIIALDIDINKRNDPKIGNGWEYINKNALNIPVTLKQTTPSGGTHFIFKAPDDVPFGNTVKQKIGLDTRGDGGWIGYYNFEGEVLAEAPQWVLDLGCKSSIDTSTARPEEIIRVSPEIANRMIAESLERVREAPHGESNDTLNRESFKVGQLVASESVSYQYAFDELFRAAKERGKPDGEARATITSGLDAAQGKPLVSPFGPTTVIQTEIPPPPAAPVSWTPRRLTKADLLNTSMLRKPQLFREWSTRDITITTADGGTGKTTLMLYEAVCLALGVSFLGFSCVEPGKTLFITGEDTAEKLAAMLGQIMRQMRIMDDDEKVETIIDSIMIKKDSDLTLITLDPKTRFLKPNDMALAQVLQTVTEFQPDKIVFDPISSFWGAESSLNDMNKAVIKFVSELVTRSGAQVEMINHMGKASSQSKDVTQFAGRGGTGLPSNSRVARVLRALTDDEYTDHTGKTLADKQSAMLCNVGKFTDGSDLLNKPFVIVRDGHLFTREVLSPQAAREAEKSLTDDQRVLTYVKNERKIGRFPNKKVIIGHFMQAQDSIPEKRVLNALAHLVYEPLMGEKLHYGDHPDQTISEKVYIVTDDSGKEI